MQTSERLPIAWCKVAGISSSLVHYHRDCATISLQEKVCNFSSIFIAPLHVKQRKRQASKVGICFVFCCFSNMQQLFCSPIRLVTQSILFMVTPSYPTIAWRFQASLSIRAWQSLNDLLTVCQFLRSATELKYFFHIHPTFALNGAHLQQEQTRR